MRVVLAVLVAALAGTPAVQPSGLSVDAWKEDVEWFARELPRRHGNAFHSLPQAQFRQMVDSLIADLPRLPQHSVPVRLLMITAQIGDAHTYVKLPESFRGLPIALAFFGDDLRVAATTSDTRDLLGARVVAVGDTPVAQALTRVGTVVSRQENRWFGLVNLPALLAVTEVLHALGLSSSPDGAEVTFDVNGQTVRRTLRGAPLKERRVTPPPSTALSRQRPGEPFWFAPIPEEPSTVYVSFRAYDNLMEHSRSLMEFLDTQKPSRVVIDLRLNTGGDYTKVRRHLIPALRQRGYAGPDRLFVITGRRTFSAAMNSAADFRKELGARLVGEPPGERPNSWQENDEMRLPNSKLEVSYSTKYYKFVDEDVDALMPDELIAPDWESFSAGRDRALEWIVARSGGVRDH